MNSTERAAADRARLAFSYRAHGLALRSELELPEAVPSTFDEPDLVIRRGDAPPALTNVRLEGAGHQVAPGVYRLEVEGVGVYGLSGGRDVVVAPAPGATPAAVRAPLLSSVMGAALHERGSFAMHASAVAVEGGCVLFAGAQGAGKSTLAAACHAAGLPILSDDLVAIEISGLGTPLAHPGYRVVKFRRDSLEHFGASFSVPYRLEGRVEKFAARIGGSHEESPRPVRAFFDIEIATRISMERVTGTAKVRKILGRMYRSRMIPALGHADRTFITAGAIARAISVWSLRVPRRWDSVARTVAEIQRTLAMTSS